MRASEVYIAALTSRDAVKTAGIVSGAIGRLKGLLRTAVPYGAEIASPPGVMGASEMASALMVPGALRYAVRTNRTLAGLANKGTGVNLARPLHGSRGLPNPPTLNAAYPRLRRLVYGTT